MTWPTYNPVSTQLANRSILSRHTRDVWATAIRLTDALLQDALDLPELKVWLREHPCTAKLYVCDATELAILAQLMCLTQQPINDHRWQNFRDWLGGY